MKTWLCLCWLTLSAQLVLAQVDTRRTGINESTVVTDSTGKKLAYADWLAMIKSGEYLLTLKGPGAGKPELMLVKRSGSRMTGRPGVGNALMEPQPSPFFTTGKKFSAFSGREY